MTVSDIQAAIAGLPAEERKELIDSLVPKKAALTPELLQHVVSESRDALEDEEEAWLDWDEVKGERPVA